MTIKAKWKKYFDASRMYSWVFINGVMKICDERTYKVTVKENNFHRTRYYERNDKKTNESKNENN